MNRKEVRIMRYEFNGYSDVEALLTEKPRSVDPRPSQAQISDALAGGVDSNSLGHQKTLHNVLTAAGAREIGSNDTKKTYVGFNARTGHELRRAASAILSTYSPEPRGSGKTVALTGSHSNVTVSEYFVRVEPARRHGK